MLREAVTVNGITDLCVNKLDVLSGLAEIPLATAYRIDGKLTHDFPMTLDEVARAEPVYETWPGWDADLTCARRLEDLPAATRRYVDRIATLADVPVALLSVGPGRDQTIEVADPFAR
jgi:adenylosuccinate synthase